jgi:hypothetical protein
VEIFSLPNKIGSIRQYRASRDTLKKANVVPSFIGAASVELHFDGDVRIFTLSGDEQFAAKKELHVRFIKDLFLDEVPPLA